MKFRHRFFKFSLLLVLGIALASACNNQDTESNSPSLGETRTIEHAMGQTQVPIEPKRVVTLDGFALENVLGLGEKPVATALNGSKEQQPSHLQGELTGVALLGSFAQPNIEKVVEADPDLILSITGIAENIYEELSQIAPTVLAESADGSGSWKQYLSLHGKALGKTQAAQEVMQNYEKRLEQFQNKMGDQLQQIEVSVVRIYPGQISLYQKGSFCGVILEDAGLSRPPSQRGEGVQQMISKESLNRADGDVIFVWTSGDDYQSSRNQKTALEELKSDPLWSKLRAVQQGNVYQVPGYWLGFGPLAANAVIDDLFRYLVEEEESSS